MEKVYIRADANEEIASGHVMRCLSIADQLKKMGIQVVFLTADEKPVEMIRARGFCAEMLGANWRNKEEELDLVKRRVETEDIQVLLVDSYQATKFYLEELNKWTKVFYIDDLCEQLFDIEGVISYGFPDNMRMLQKKYENSSLLLTKLFFGLEYIPLRSDFMNVPQKIIRNSVADIMITTGGSDTFQITSLFVRELVSQYPDMNFHLVVGRFFGNKEDLRHYSDIYQNLILYENFTDMAQLMQKCDIAISAGGTTLLELCACGTPTICFSVAENQLQGVVCLGTSCTMMSLGAYSEYANELGFAEAVKEAIDKLLDKDNRQTYSRKMKALVDGKGARRIAEALVGERLIVEQ